LLGLLDEFTRRAAARRREGPVAFLGEQAGAAEDGLKRALTLEFVTRPAIQRAYLAQVGSQRDGTPTMALCLASKQPDDHAIVRRVGEIFERMFGKDAMLDIVFLSTEQETELGKVCRPFYSIP
jgi:hypothetical protein